MTSFPPGWSNARFKDVADIQLGKMLDKAKNQGVLTPYLRNVNIRWGRVDISDVLTMPMSDEERTKFSIEVGDVLVCEGGEPGRAAVWRSGPTDLKFQKALLRLRSNAAACPDWLANYLRFASQDGILEASFTGTTIKHLPREALQVVALPLPPLAEQHRIVAKIESLSAKSKRARDHLDHAPKLIQKYKQAILSRAFQRSLEKNITRKNIRSISNLILSLDQGWSPKCESERAKFDNQWAVMKTTAVQPILFEAKENKKLPENLEPRPSLQVSEGDVIITRAGPRNRVGICAYVENTRPNLMICDKVYRLKIDKRRAYPKYITLMLNSPELLSVIEEMKSGINDSGLNLTQSKFLDIEVPCPSLDVQQKVVGLVETAFASINRLALEVASARRLVDHLDQVVLSKAFRGELVPQDPDDEPASVLLEQIRAERAGEAHARRGRGRPRLATAI